MKRIQFWLATALAWIGVHSLALYVLRLPRIAGGADEVTTTVLANDRTNVFIARKLLKLSMIKERMSDFAEQHKLPSHESDTIRLVKFNRIILPMNTASETDDAANTPLTISAVNATVDNWEIIVTATKLGHLTSKHPVFQALTGVVSDAMRRLRDWQTHEALLGAANVRYAGGAANRSTLTGGAVVTDTDIRVVVADMRDERGATEYYEQSELYAGVCDSHVEHDIRDQANFRQAHEFQNEPVKRAYIGDHEGVRWHRSNFMPKYERLASLTLAYTSADGGSLAASTNYFVKITRVDEFRGFEEEISPEESKVSKAGDAAQTLSITLPTKANHRYHVYAGTSAAAMYKIAAANEKAGLTPPFDDNQTIKVKSIPSSGTTAPVTPRASVTVHRSYIFGKEAYGQVELNEASLEAHLTPAASTHSNPTGKRRKCAASMVFKAFIQDDNFFNAVESSSAF